MYDKQMKEFREQRVVSNTWNMGAKNLEFIKNSKNKLVLLFMFYLE